MSYNQSEGFDFDFGVLTNYFGSESRENKAPQQDSDDEYDSSTDDDRKRKAEPKPKSQEQIVRRRERNRVLAKKTRQRKKVFFEDLQTKLNNLALENEKLKRVVKEKLPEEIGNGVLSTCTTELPPIITASLSNKVTTYLDSADYRLMLAIQAAQRSFVITDPSLPDNPIIFASKGFLELSGYDLKEVLGRNCRFMQGPKTDPASVNVMRQGISEGKDTSVCLLNYRRDGTEFYNQIFVAALRDAESKIINYVGVQVEVSRPDIDINGTTSTENGTDESTSQKRQKNSNTNKPQVSKPKTTGKAQGQAPSSDLNRNSSQSDGIAVIPDPNNSRPNNQYALSNMQLVLGDNKDSANKSCEKYANYNYYSNMTMYPIYAPAFPFTSLYNIPIPESMYNNFESAPTSNPSNNSSNKSSADVLGNAKGTHGEINASSSSTNNNNNDNSNNRPANFVPGYHPPDPTMGMGMGMNMGIPMPMAMNMVPMNLGMLNMPMPLNMPMNMPMSVPMNMTMPAAAAAASTSGALGVPQNVDTRTTPSTAAVGGGVGTAPLATPKASVSSSATNKPTTSTSRLHIPGIEDLYHIFDE